MAGISIDVEMNPNLDELVDDLHKVADKLSPVGDDAEAKAMLVRALADLEEVKALQEQRLQRYRSTKRSALIAFGLAVYLGSRR